MGSNILKLRRRPNKTCLNVKSSPFISVCKLNIKKKLQITESEGNFNISSITTMKKHSQKNSYDLFSINCVLSNLFILLCGVFHTPPGVQGLLLLLRRKLRPAEFKSLVQGHAVIHGSLCGERNRSLCIFYCIEHHTPDTSTGLLLQRLALPHVSVVLRQWFLLGGGGGVGFASRGHVTMPLTLLVVTAGGGRGGCYWHRVGRDQGCYRTPYSAQDSPYDRR